MTLQRDYKPGRCTGYCAKKEEAQWLKKTEEMSEERLAKRVYMEEMPRKRQLVHYTILCQNFYVLFHHSFQCILSNDRSTAVCTNL